MSQKALKPGSLVLITGVNGYIGAHVASQLLSLGYRVRGTARDEAKLAVARKAFQQHPGQFEGVVLSDHSAADAFEDIVKGCDGVVHIASDLSFGEDPNAVITPTVRALESVLAAAVKEDVKRFVYTSSFITTIDLSSFADGKVLNAASWNTADVEAAWKPPPYTPERAFSVYAASKIASEQAAWKFVKENKPSFVFSSVLPALCVGPVAYPGSNASTAAWIGGLYNGDQDLTQRMMHLPPGWAVDVRDVARLHISGLLEPDIANERLLGAAEHYSYSSIVEALMKIDPSRQDYQAAPNDDVDTSTVEEQLSIELLNRSGRDGFISLEQSLRDQIASY